MSTSNPLSSSPVRIPGFHPGDPGSNPGNGIFLFSRSVYFVSYMFTPHHFFFLVTVHLHVTQVYFFLSARRQWMISMHSYCKQCSGDHHCSLIRQLKVTSFQICSHHVFFSCHVTVIYIFTQVHFFFLQGRT